jgi:alanyl-tRNA synthetase
MMNAREIRAVFLDFFKSKDHTIVSSAPIVIKNDPTLMFTNAGMNQFKDIFLGDKTPVSKRVADTQKCLRVSGKHNDLEEVGIDTYHHTMFEMLGNWSFGDYFKEEAIAWAWELLTKIYKLPADRLFVTIFKGDESEKIPKDDDAVSNWKKWIPEDRILPFGKKDNFWEMGDTGPCGPCSEIHFDNRSDEERKQLDGKTLVNAGDPQVIEIWNLVFIQFNRLSNGSLQSLPAKHVDTGMGFERLTRVLQQKASNYDTDIFQPLINFIEKRSAIQYGSGERTDIAMRVMADHIRAISFAIADGQLPSNTGAGYVIRRILRRAVRYYYSFLGLNSPVLFELVPILAKEFGDVFPEIQQQQSFVSKVIEEEEHSFLKTLEAGLKKISQLEGKIEKNKMIVDGAVAFELYDTYGFPPDLTKLISREKGWEVDEAGFEAEMKKQKDRSRKATAIESSDWTELKKMDKIQFVGYDTLQSKGNVVKYRQQKTKDAIVYQVVLDRTPFYAESGGQVGDKGKLKIGDEEVEVVDTKKENELIIHYVDRFPSSFEGELSASVTEDLRRETMNNHTATHLLHAALRNILGTHVQQKGSMVAPAYLRFDFSHFSKMTSEELNAVEDLVNKKIRENIAREVEIMPVDQALKTGAMALFGEKYGDQVRVITFDKNFSRELCGGTHVPSTGAIGYFKIISETAVAAGVRRIEAVTGEAAADLIRNTFTRLDEVGKLIGNTKDVEKGILQLKEENSRLKKQLDDVMNKRLQQLKEELKAKAERVNGFTFIGASGELRSPDALKKLAHELRNEVDNLIGVLGAEDDGKAYLCIIISENLVAEKSLDAGKMIRVISKQIDGGGGGQKFFATAGGSNPAGIENAILEAKKMVLAETGSN